MRWGGASTHAPARACSGGSALAYWRLGEHAVDGPCGGVDHAAGAAGWAEPAVGGSRIPSGWSPPQEATEIRHAQTAALAEGGDALVLAARGAVRAAEAVRQDPAVEKRAELAFDEARECPRVVLADAVQGGLEVVGEDLVEDGPLGRPALPRVEPECAHADLVGRSPRTVTAADGGVRVPAEDRRRARAPQAAGASAAESGSGASSSEGVGPRRALRPPPVDLKTSVRVPVPRGPREPLPPRHRQPAALGEGCLRRRAARGAAALGRPRRVVERRPGRSCRAGRRVSRERPGAGPPQPANSAAGRPGTSARHANSPPASG
jgi:hypothetical protein